MDAARFPARIVTPWLRRPHLRRAAVRFGVLALIGAAAALFITAGADGTAIASVLTLAGALGGAFLVTGLVRFGAQRLLLRVRAALRRA